MHIVKPNRVMCNYPMPDGTIVRRRISPEVCEWHRLGGWGQEPDPICRRGCRHGRNTTTEADHMEKPDIP